MLLQILNMTHHTLPEGERLRFLDVVGLCNSAMQDCARACLHVTIKATPLLLLPLLLLLLLLLLLPLLLLLLVIRSRTLHCHFAEL